MNLAVQLIGFFALCIISFALGYHDWEKPKKKKGLKNDEYDSNQH